MKTIKVKLFPVHSLFNFKKNPNRNNTVVLKTDKNKIDFQKIIFSYQDFKHEKTIHFDIEIK